MNNSQLDGRLDGDSRRAPNEPAPARLPDALMLAPLLEVARELAALLLPVHMRPAFRIELHDGLIAAARQREVQQALFLLPDHFNPVMAHVPPEWLDRLNGWVEYAGHEWNEFSEGDRRWVVGAAAALSLAGILAYVIQRRGRPAIFL